MVKRGWLGVDSGWYICPGRENEAQHEMVRGTSCKNELADS